MGEKYLSFFELKHIVFDQIEFHRIGFQNDGDKPEFELQCVGQEIDKDNYRVSLILRGEKEGEYKLLIALSGYFHINTDTLNVNVPVEMLLQKNATSILLPYIRSQLSTLTAQPETECIVLPTINVNNFIKNE